MISPDNGNNMILTTKICPEIISNVKKIKAKMKLNTLHAKKHPLNENPRSLRLKKSTRYKETINNNPGR